MWTNDNFYVIAELVLNVDKKVNKQVEITVFFFVNYDMQRCSMHELFELYY